MNEHKINIHKLRGMKQRGEKISALTAYDFFTAKVMDEVGIQLILVGDSLGMIVQGLQNTIPVTLEEIAYHGRAVARGRPARPAISLSVIGAGRAPNACNSLNPRSRLSTKSVARVSPSARFGLTIKEACPDLESCYDY